MHTDAEILVSESLGAQKIFCKGRSEMDHRSAKSRKISQSSPHDGDKSEQQV